MQAPFIPPPFFSVWVASVQKGSVQFGCRSRPIRFVRMIVPFLCYVRFSEALYDPVQRCIIRSVWVGCVQLIKFGSVPFRCCWITVLFVWLGSVPSDYFRFIYFQYNSVQSWSPCPIRIENLPQCRRCLKWLTKNEHWSHFELESAPFLALVLKKIPGLSKHDLVDAKWIWTGMGNQSVRATGALQFWSVFFFVLLFLLKGMRRASTCKRQYVAIFL